MKRKYVAWGFYHKQCSKSMRHKLMDKIYKTYEIVGKQAKDWNEFLLERQVQHE